MQFPTTTMSLIRAYREATKAVVALQIKHRNLSQQVADLITPISHAQAEVNKAREALLKHIEAGNR